MLLLLGGFLILMLLGLPDAVQLASALAVYFLLIVALRAVPRELYQLIPGWSRA